MGTDGVIVSCVRRGLEDHDGWIVYPDVGTSVNGVAEATSGCGEIAHWSSSLAGRPRSVG